MTLNQARQVLGRKIRQREFAQAVDVVPRTIRNWKSRRSLKDFPKLGRPAHDERAHRLAFLKTGREYLKQGRCGSPSIAAALRGHVPLRLVQKYVRLFKACDKRREAARIEINRERISVTAKNALWVQDGTQVGRERAGNRIETQVVKDRGSLVTIGLATGPTADSKDVIQLLKKLRNDRGLPLVLGTDNGAPYVSEETQKYLEREKVVHLRSMPRTPEQNGAAEIGIRELKLCAGLVSASHVSAEAAHTRLVAAATQINKFRIRLSKSLKTGTELDEELRESYDQVDRDRFYQECRSRIRTIQRSTSGARARRMAEREVIFSTLEKYGLVKRYRGGSQATTKAEIFS